MNILHISDYSVPFGGAEQLLFRTRELFEARGHRTQILGSSKGEDLASYFSRWLSLRYYGQTRGSIASFRPDIVHFHGPSRIVSPTPLLAARQAGIPCVATLHTFGLACPKTWGIFEDGKPCRKGFNSRCWAYSCPASYQGRLSTGFHFAKWLKVGLHRSVMRQAVDHFICPSRELYAWTRRDFDLRADQISYLPNPAGLTPSSGDGAAQRRGFLFAGRLSPEKGIPVALQALAIARAESPELQLRIAGDGPLDAQLRAQAASLGLERNVHFLGRLAAEELALEYARALAVVLPSVWMENNPLSALEALGCATALIASDVGGLPDLVDPGETGWLFPMGDAAALADRFLRLERDPELARTMGLRGRAKLAREFSDELYVERLEKVYGDLLARFSSEGRR